jgi:signal transduction histidine kinase
MRVMQRMQQAGGNESVAEHTRFLANVSRYLMSQDLDPMLEGISNAALPLLGDVCAIDRALDARSVRVLEVRKVADAWIEPPEQLTSIVRGEIRVDGNRSRLTVPIGGPGERFGTLSFAAKNRLIHGPAELALAQELADRMALAIQNIRTRFDLSEAVTEREKLISIAAHELRGPACSLRICVQALHRMESSAVPPKSARLLKIIEREERRLARLIDDLLDLARLRSGHFQLELEPVDLCDVVREVAARLTQEATTVETPIDLELPETLIGDWDRSRLDQIVTNLVGNAIKFGRNNPVTIRVTEDATRGCARLSVTDHGPGIEPGVQQQIFEPFKRAVTSKQYDGLGLGLYIVRSVVSQLGGVVRVTSAPGCGATFTVELPLNKR